MKRMTSLLSFLVVVVFLAMSTLAMAKAVPITEENVALLKGKYEGDRSIVFRGTVTCYLKTEVEITNDHFPLEGTIVFHMKMGKPLKLEIPKTAVLKDGKILIQSPNDVRQWWIFILDCKGEKMELRGEYQIVASGNTITGNFYLKKK